uniref:Transmembrane protein n=1 Tax=Mesocestoides corti TaxID=53468 RepID=A0A5K3G673_MESCO
MERNVHHESLTAFPREVHPTIGCGQIDKILHSNRAQVDSCNGTFQDVHTSSVIHLVVFVFLLLHVVTCCCASTSSHISISRNFQHTGTPAT